jgi:hypothetical protein
VDKNLERRDNSYLWFILNILKPHYSLHSSDASESLKYFSSEIFNCRLFTKNVKEIKRREIILTYTSFLKI